MAAAQGGPSYHQPATLEEVRTLWIGDLPYWADESYLHGWFSPTGEVLSIKVIRNKITGQPEGYGFVEFSSHAVAENILKSYNGTQIPGTELNFRLNWASFGIGERRPDAGPEHSIFVGDLAPDVTDYHLQETFRTHYPSVRGAKVVTDPSTGRSKGYGFVKFADETERNRAMVEMNGAYCSTRPMRISAATPKKTTTSVLQQQYAVAKALYPAAPVYAPPVQTIPVDNDVNNTAMYAGNYLQGYDQYPQGTAQDPYGYTYPGYAPYPQQVDGSQDPAVMSATAPALELRDEVYDPLATPDVNKLNAAYISVHGNAILGRPMWLKTSSLAQQT